MNSPNPTCPDCKGKGKILLLNKTVDCDCMDNEIKEIYDIKYYPSAKDCDDFYGKDCRDCI